MKKIKKLLIILSVMAMCLITAVPASAAVKISSKSIMLIKGQSKTLKITGTKEKAKWSSSKKSVATVTSGGKVTALKTGKTTITAKIGKKKYTCKVKVETPKISKTSLTITKEKTSTLKMSGTSQKVSWKSSNKKVATVTSKGKVKGVKAGNCTITATVGGKKYTCRVTVTSKKTKKISVIGFSLEYYGTRIKEGESEKIGTYIYPDNATNKNVEWYSSNESVASVNSLGVVTGKSLGEATITAVCDGKKATCEIEVIRNFKKLEAESKITYKSYKTDEGIVIIAKNNYKYAMNLEVNCIYYNAQKTMIGKTSDVGFGLESGKECALLCSNPYGAYGNNVEYDSYSINFNASEASVIGNSPSIVCIGNFGAENVMVHVSNHGQDVTSTMVAVVFYKNGKVVGYDCGYADVDNFGSSDYLQFDFPYDSEYKTIYPDDFKIYVNHSFRDEY